MQHEVHHVDPLVQMHFPGDNYAAFLTELLIAKHAEQWLELRRSSCPKCTPEAFRPSQQSSLWLMSGEA
ncbi:MAG: hypothetical protein SGPRY_006001 [Prymnesium sp.]